MKIEIGKIFNHDTTNAVGNIVNHNMENAAPDTKRIFNHDLRDCADEEELARLLGVFKYPGRVLGETNPSDVIQLHPDLRSSWDWITSHYDRIGLRHTKTVIWDDNFDLIRRFQSMICLSFSSAQKLMLFVQMRDGIKWLRV